MNRRKMVADPALDGALTALDAVGASIHDLVDAALSISCVADDIHAALSARGAKARELGRALYAGCGWDETLRVMTADVARFRSFASVKAYLEPLANTPKFGKESSWPENPDVLCSEILARWTEGRTLLGDVILPSFCRRLGDDVTIDGSLDFGHSALTQVGRNLHVRGNLSFGNGRHAGFQVFGEGLRVDGDLDQYDVSAESGIIFGADMVVGGTMRCSATGVKRLPDGLKVGVNFYLSGSERYNMLEALPVGLEVGRDVHIDHVNLPLMTNTVIGRNLTLYGEVNLWRNGPNVPDLHPSLRIGGSLTVTGCSNPIPGGITVGEHLLLACAVFPRDVPPFTGKVDVGGRLFASRQGVIGMVGVNRTLASLEKMAFEFGIRKVTLE